MRDPKESIPMTYTFTTKQLIWVFVSILSLAISLLSGFYFIIDKQTNEINKINVNLTKEMGDVRLEVSTAKYELIQEIRKLEIQQLQKK
jgi:hypothetical protein